MCVQVAMATSQGGETHQCRGTDFSGRLVSREMYTPECHLRDDGKMGKKLVLVADAQRERAAR